VFHLSSVSTKPAGCCTSRCFLRSSPQILPPPSTALHRPPPPTAHRPPPTIHHPHSTFATPTPHHPPTHPHPPLCPTHAQDWCNPALDQQPSHVLVGPQNQWAAVKFSSSAFWGPAARVARTAGTGTVFLAVPLRQLGLPLRRRHGGDRPGKVRGVVGMVWYEWCDVATGSYLKTTVVWVL
jgi:hypothetical protein